MPTLREWFAKCKEDTRKYINKQAASSLSSHCGVTDDELVNYIKRTIRIKNNQANGCIIHQCNGVSLEAIVAKHCVELFTQDDIVIAKRTLGL